MKQKCHLLQGNMLSSSFMLSFCPVSTDVFSGLPFLWHHPPSFWGLSGIGMQHKYISEPVFSPT